MNIFKKIFGNISENNKDSQGNPYELEIDSPIDEKFTYNFKNNGGKFLYCENLNELREQFENIVLRFVAGVNLILF